MSTSTIGEMIELENHHQITIMVIRDSFKNENIFSDVKLSLKLFGIYFVRNRTFNCPSRKKIFIIIFKVWIPCRQHTNQIIKTNIMSNVVHSQWVTRYALHDREANCFTSLTLLPKSVSSLINTVWGIFYRVTSLYSL